MITRIDTRPSTLAATIPAMTAGESGLLATAAPALALKTEYPRMKIRKTDARVVAVGSVDVQIVRPHLHTATGVTTFLTAGCLVHHNLVKIEVAATNRQSEIVGSVSEVVRKVLKVRDQSLCTSLRHLNVLASSEYRALGS